MRVFCMASVLHHTSFLTTRVTFKLRGLDLCQGDVLRQSFPACSVVANNEVWVAEMPVANILQGWNIACVLS